MIHAFVKQSPYDIDPKPEKYLELYISGESIQQFHQLLIRALNTAPPEKYPDWIKLVDRLESLLQYNNKI